jgi:hypothetical protein
MVLIFSVDDPAVFKDDEQVAQFPHYVLRGVLIAIVREPHQVAEEHGDIVEAPGDDATGEFDFGDGGRRKDVVEKAIP